MSKYLIIGLVIISLLGCKKISLDNLAFPAEKLDSYQFENYDDGGEDLPTFMQVDSDHRELIKMSSYSSENEDSYDIYGVYIGEMSSIQTDTVILYLHGQSQHMDAYWKRATLLANIGEKYNYGVFMIDYRGYGMSQGKSTELGLSEDTQTALNWLVNEKGVDPNKIIVYGFSLGCIPGIERCGSSNIQPAKLIIESPLASVQNLVSSSTAIDMDATAVVNIKFENSENIKNVNQPLYWIHGIEDSYIAIHNGDLIYANYNGPYQQKNRVPEAGHGDVPTKMGVAYYLERMRNFIRM